MAIRNILFDLDGTLLPMDLEVFLASYLGKLSARMAKHGYEPRSFVAAIMTGTAAMVKNDGRRTNEECFFEAASAALGRDVRADLPHLDAFYREEFDSVRDSCGHLSEAGAVIKSLKAMGYRLVLATNPIFPRIATEKRIKWAGLDKDDFELFTTYEASRHCKPSLDYYRDIMAALDLDPAECLMVGNDVGEDMIAERLGMKVFLLPASLINRGGEDISRYPKGTLTDLLEYLKSI